MLGREIPIIWGRSDELKIVWAELQKQENLNE